ncbi:hypothetical protein glysoja_019188 [Glycine soja]|nr:hypothetical protein glysoja_019188 [Glycine soja]
MIHAMGTRIHSNNNKGMIFHLKSLVPRCQKMVPIMLVVTHPKPDQNLIIIIIIILETHTPIIIKKAMLDTVPRLGPHTGPLKKMHILGTNTGPLKKKNNFKDALVKIY